MMVQVFSSSTAKDLGYLALADSSAALAASGEHALIIGGHMVTLHTLRQMKDLTEETDRLLREHH